MELRHLYGIVYKVQDRENFARGLWIFISHDNFLKIHSECRRMYKQPHLRAGRDYFNTLKIDSVTVGWSYSINGDMYFYGREGFPVSTLKA